MNHLNEVRFFVVMGINRFSEQPLLRITSLVLLICMSLALMPAAHALDLFGKSSKSKFLPVDQAFQTIQRTQNNQLTIDFVVVPQHYIYKDRVQLKFDGKSIKPTQFTKKATFVDDPEFGRVAVFTENVTAVFEFPQVKDKRSLKLKWQGCAKAGLCYPPVTEAITVFPTKKKALKPQHAF